MDISAAYNAQLTVVRTSEGMGVGSDNTVTINALNQTETINGTSTPPATLDACFNLTLTAGAGSINLAALLDPDLGTVVGTGLRVQYVRLVNDAAAAMTIVQGASNGYDGFGAAFSVIIPPGGEFTFKTNDGGTDIGAANRLLDVTGTGSQILSCHFVMG